MNAFQRELTGLRRQQQVLYILVFFFAAVLVWVGVSLLSSQRRTGITAEQTKLARPLTPTINREVINQIKNKRAYTAAELARFPIYKIVVSSDGKEEQVVRIDEVLPTSSATPVPSLQPSPTAAPGATTSSTLTTPASASAADQVL
jgi:hypothetical protein